MRKSLIAAGLLVLAPSGRRPLSIIFDGSNSLWGELPDASRKIEVAKDVLPTSTRAVRESRGHPRPARSSAWGVRMPRAVPTR
jgi:hypothetical protein